MFVEIIYETGTKSVAQYKDEDEMMSALKAHHDRAKKGERGLSSEPNSHPAERIAKVLVYNKHPSELNPEQTMSADVMSKELTNIVKNVTDAGAVALPDVVAAVRELSNPVVEDAGPQESMFKMKEEKVITEGWDD